MDYDGRDGGLWLPQPDNREGAGLTGIGIDPSFSIGQRALLVRTSEGNILYDCVSYLDDEAEQAIEALGGIQAICLSHPHFYDSMVTWSHAFGNATIYVPEADRQYVMRPDPVIRYWDGAPLELFSGVTLIQCGGHFPGSAVLHWADGAEGKGSVAGGRLDHGGARPTLRQLHDQLS